MPYRACPPNNGPLCDRRQVPGAPRPIAKPRTRGSGHDREF
ncbi:hypothetical protein C4K40_2043 [Pseudomonas sp. CMR5c]|nr:hypothetical protein C4K40_2043 [Pseudomonas sp. CMR5c]